MADLSGGPRRLDDAAAMISCMQGCLWSRRTVPKLLLAIVAAGGPGMSVMGVEEPHDGAPLLPIATVLADPDIGAPYPVRVRGVVTWRQGRGIIIQDDGGGIWIDAERSRQTGGWRGDEEVLQGIRPGLEVEANGMADRGGYIPTILAADILVLGERSLPRPLPIDRDRFFFGFDCCQRVTVRGVVQGYREDGGDWILLLSDAGHGFTASIPKPLLPGGAEPLVDTVIRLVGVAVAHFNTRGEFLAPWLRVVHAEDITIERPADGDTPRPEQVPLRAIAHYRSRRHEDHRIRTRGIVTYASPSEFVYLQEGCGGIQVQTEADERFAPGDRVEVDGFAKIQGRVAGIVEARVRRIATGAPPPPLAVDPGTILRINADASHAGQMAVPGDYQGCLVTFPAQVVDFQRSGIGGQVLLSAGDTGVSAIAKPDVFARLQAIEPGSMVQATGIIQFGTPPSDDRLLPTRPFCVDRLELIVRSSDDFVVTRRPSWWKPRRLAALLAAVAAAAVVALGWVVLLRRKVASQLALIESQLQAEAATEERTRIAREFHDTLEQGLAAVSLRLDVAAYTTADEHARTVLRQQRQLLSGLQTETRDFLWDLRDPVHVEGTLEQSLALQLRNLGELATIPLVLDVHGTLPALPQLAHYHLLRIAREAVNNAIKHSKARRIDLRVDAQPRSLTITVRDDGTGFDVAARSQAEGHFGIRGMQERARRIGATFAIASGVGAETRVTITLPLTPSCLGNGGSPAPAA